jgi:hypothetical protein
VTAWPPENTSLDRDAEARAAAARRPEQVRVLVRARGQHVAAGGDHEGTAQRVRGEPESAHQQPDPEPSVQPATPTDAMRAPVTARP